MPQRADDEAAWSDLRRRRIRLGGTFLLFVPIMGLAYAAARLMDVLFGSRQYEGYLLLPVAVLWMFGFVAASIHHNSFRCPRCHKPFFWTCWRSNPAAGRCLHCGLPRGASPD